MSAHGCRLKGLVLAGGTGSRLRPLTHTGPKQLLPIANKPILCYAIEDLVRSGVAKIAVVVGDSGPRIRAALGDGNRFGAEITYFQQEAPLGLAHAVLCAQDWLGDDPFVLYLGDNLLPGGIGELVASFLEHRPAALLLTKAVSDPERFGVAVAEGDRVVRLVEKPAAPPSDLAVLGVYCLDRRLVEAAGRIAPSARGELEITDAIQQLIDRGQPVRHRRLAGAWADTGRVEDLIAANELVLGTLARDVRGRVDAASRLEGAVVVAKGACVADSVLVGPLIVGEGAEVRECRIGPGTAIDRHSQLRRCGVDRSIVLEGACIDTVARPITRSVIGRHARIGACTQAPPAHRLILGDHAAVGLG